MDNLIAAVRAAIDETDRIALAATPGSWHLDNETYPEYLYQADSNVSVVAGGRWGGEASVFESAADAVHIALHDPKRVHDRCVADREILDLREKTAAIDAAATAKLLAGEQLTRSDSQDLANCGREICAYDAVIELLAHTYGVRP